MKITKFQQLVYGATKKIPKGKVSTYREIARAIKRPRSARAVGNALNCNPFAPQVPCHRVVRSDGTVGGFADGSKEKIKILRKEGIAIKNNRIIGFRDRLFVHKS
jgi:methylated-DNA-[protein]-cysteine S-methyltransferase